MSTESSDKSTAPTDHLLDYRKQLVAAEQKSQEDFDKTVLSLSGGALGISFVFLKDVVGEKPIVDHAYLLSAWICWGLSTLAVLASYYMSHLALREAITQVDKGTIYGQTPGGRYASATAVLNAVGAVLFLFGVLSITLFASSNFSSKGESNVRAKVTSASASASAPYISASAATAGR